MFKKMFLIFVVLSLYAIQIHSQWSPSWTATNSWSSTSADAGYKLKVKNGDIYVTANSYDGSSLSVPYAIRTIKYNSSGTQQWVATYTSSGSIRANGIDVDDNGNVYVVGTKDNGTNDDYITIKYNSSGSQQWVTTYNGPGNGDDYANAIDIDDNVNLYITGGSLGSGTNSDYATIKYNSSGAEQWVRRYNGNGNGYDEGICLGVSNDGDHPGVYLSGTSYFSSTEGKNWVTLYYEFDGDLGGTVHYGAWGDQDDYPSAIFVSTDVAFVTGYKIDGDQDGYNWATMKNAWTDADPAVFYEDWCTRYVGPTEDEDDKPFSIIIDDDDNPNVYVTGYRHSSSSNIDYTTVKYDNGGNEQWVAVYNSGSNILDIGESIAVNSSYVFVTGVAGSPGASNIATIQYDITDGAEICVATYNGNSNLGDMGYSLGVDGNNVYVTGVTNEVDNFGNSSDVITLKYVESDCGDGDKRLSLQNSHILQSIPKEFNLAQNYPNPFNPTTNIRFGLPKNSLVTLKIFDVLGREVAILVNNQNLEAGNYAFDFDASNLPSGIYYYKLQADQFSDVKKMAVIK